MNKISAVLDKSDYEGYWDYLNYNIDNYWLDEKLDELFPDNMYKGLIPTLVYWMEIEKEKKVVWERILPKENQTTLCPILMCPDDNDFSCTIIIAEITNQKNRVIKWKRLGLDKTQEYEAEKIGTSVEWFLKFEELEFEYNEYIQMVENFKNRLDYDRNRIKNL